MDADTLKRLISYDPETGEFVRLVATGYRGCHKAGAKIGRKMVNGYISMSVGGREWLAHRLAWLYMTGGMPVGHVDHINGVRDDNRFSNLRDVPGRVNNENLRNPRKDNKCGFLGVSWDAERGKFKAQLQSGSVRITKRFETAEEAHAYYVLVKRQFHEGCTI